MIIIHGENIIASRQKLIEIIDLAKNQKQEIIRQESKTLDEARLEELLGSSDLFGTKKTIIIESLHSLQTSKKKKLLIKMCANSELHNLVLWEKRTLTKTMLKQFGTAENYEFKASKTLFAWLDLFGQKNTETKKLQLLHEAINKDGEYFCFIMLIRQFRLLIQAKTGEKIGGAPFMITKLNKQAALFTIEELLKTYKEILKMDYALKTSKNLLSMSQWLDLLSIKL
jgi:DNA polymerase III delta subunit